MNRLAKPALPCPSDPEPPLPTPPFPRSYWLIPGSVLCGRYPFRDDRREAEQVMRSLLQAGVRAFVDLTESHETGDGGLVWPYADEARRILRELGGDPAQLQFERFPVEDLSVPRTEGRARAILRSLRRFRHQGMVSYLHCLGGRGRTGVAAGCLLADTCALDGDEALSSLTRQWQACSVAASSASPEFPRQREFVKRWARPAVAWAERSRAALIGAAVGDALGVPVEFRSRGQLRSDPVTGMRGFGSHHQPAGTWSDDSSMIVATMRGFLQSGEADPAAAMAEFHRWSGEGAHTPHGRVFDIGGATSAAISRFAAGQVAEHCGGTGEHSNGNGSLMRILPVALAHLDDPDLVGHASRMSALTHAHERSRFCCAFACLVLADLFHGGDIAGAIDFAWRVMDRRWDFSTNERAHFERLRPERLGQLGEHQVSGSGHVIDTLESSLWVNLRHDNYRDAVLHAVNLGDDTDTTGCVAGAMAGLLHGEEAIPGDWRQTLVAGDELAALGGDYGEWCRRRARQRWHKEMRRRSGVPAAR